jgi:hypothetical protein
MNPSTLQAIEKASRHRAEAFDGLCDKAITVASGLLAITVTFRTSLLASPSGAIKHPRLLIIVWASLALTIVAGFLTHYGRVDGLTRAISAMHADKKGIGVRHQFYSFCAWIMAISFVVALLTFVFFAAFNTPH